MNVVVVESPAKAKTINKYLGPDYKVLASFGHVRDLPAKDGSVQPDNDFAMSWEVDSASAKRVNEIADAVKNADALFLATDPDREGEAISWHVLDLLRKKKAIGDKPVKRVVFNAITKKAVLDAMAAPRDIDGPLVDAYLARRALDYLVGFTSRRCCGASCRARSAGRVQSVALRLVCDRENEIETLRLRGILEHLGAPAHAAQRYVRGPAGQRQMASASTGEGRSQMATTPGISRRCWKGAAFRRRERSRPSRSSAIPDAPFTTSTLQQAASSRLGFNASRTMQVAQKLYEGFDIGGEVTGLITYMRTDGVQMAPEAIEAARGAIGTVFGTQYLPEKPRFYATKAKNAQEAHEAIRPTDFNRTPDSCASISMPTSSGSTTWSGSAASPARWPRPISSARRQRSSRPTVAGRTAGLRAVGSVIKFDGFIAAYTEQREEKEDNSRRRRRRPPAGDPRRGAAWRRKRSTPASTSPSRRRAIRKPALIKKMEELGIGRPSTYASTLATLRDRGYVTIDKRKLIPDAKGRIVTAFLENFFSRYVEYDFTASLEESSTGSRPESLNWKDVLRDFWTQFFAADRGHQGTARHATSSMR